MDPKVGKPENLMKLDAGIKRGPYMLFLACPLTLSTYHRCLLGPYAYFSALTVAQVVSVTSYQSASSSSSSWSCAPTPHTHTHTHTHIVQKPLPPHPFCSSRQEESSGLPRSGAQQMSRVTALTTGPLPPGKGLVWQAEVRR